jgi:hypothetical protein
VFEKRMLSRRYVTRDEATGDWKILQNEELHKLYPLHKYNWNDDVKEVLIGMACSTNGGR